MSASRTTLLITLMVFFTASCSVISHQVRTESEPAVPFETLVEETDRYVGKTVILGGYILETKNLAGETIIEVLQAPLTFRDEPKSKDRSEGRFTVSHKGFLDPEVYSKNRKITVAGTLSGCMVEKVETCKLASREIYVWPKYEYGYRSPYHGPSGPYWRKNDRLRYYHRYR
jgi:outer membrane lipoprotein